MKPNTIEFQNSLKVLVDNVDELNEWEQGFIENVSQLNPDNLNERQLATISKIYYDYSKRKY